VPRFKPTIFKLLVMLVPVFAAAPSASAAGKLVDAGAAGAVGDGATLNTAAIQKAIDGCAASGGCTLRFPAGRYLTGTIQIKSKVTFAA
jgi:polygalacturonase